MAQKRVTIKEISAAAQVSPTTVVKALSGKPKVSEAVRAKVLAVAKELGYKPNLSARALSGNGFKIGIVVSEEPKEFNIPMFRGIDDALRELVDFKVEGSYSTFRTHNDTEDNIAALHRAMDENPDALIISAGFNRAPVAQYVHEIAEEKKIPIVLMSQVDEEFTGVALIQFDPETVGAMAEEFLELALPHGSSVAVITTNKDYLAHQRIIKSFKGRAEKTRRLNISTVMENQDKPEITYNITELILKTMPEVRGIYVTSFITVPICKCLEDNGRAGEIAVIGHDVYPEMVPYLESGTLSASIFLSPYEKGRVAIKTLFDYLNHTCGEKGEILMKPELVLQSNLHYYVERKAEDLK